MYSWTTARRTSLSRSPSSSDIPVHAPNRGVVLASPPQGRSKSKEVSGPVQSRSGLQAARHGPGPMPEKARGRMYDDILELRHNVESLLYRYATCLDDGPLEQWPQCFTEDGVYRLLPRENFLGSIPVALMHCTSKAQLEERVAALQRGHATVPYACRHLYTNLQVAPERAGRATVRANYTIYHTVDEGEVD